MRIERLVSCFTANLSQADKKYSRKINSIMNRVCIKYSNYLMLSFYEIYSQFS